MENILNWNRNKWSPKGSIPLYLFLNDALIKADYVQLQHFFYFENVYNYNP